MEMENSKTWVLVADAGKARIFSIHKARVFQEHNPKQLELIGEYTHNASRKKESDLVADKLGELGSGSLGAATPFKTQEAEQFAHELLHHLESGLKQKNYRDLILVAPPAFMGLLHKHMPHELHKLVSQNIEKDYTQNNVKDLMQNLLAHF